MVRWPWRSRKPPASNNEPSASVPTTPPSQPPTSSRKIFPSGIKLLHDGKNSAVDIIFVHGLTGDREKTWKAKNAIGPWPQTLLPSKVPNARILTFGYDAYVTDWRGMVSKNRIGNHSMNLLAAVATYREDDGTNNRPIIFVCHSLGGLVCEDALSTAQQRPERHLKNILYYTRGIVFLGTPHHGSGLAHWAESLAKAIGVLKQTNAEILAVLKNNSEVLERVQNGFHIMIRSRDQDKLPPIEITCFFEELPLPGVGTVVPSHSAILPGYIPIGIRSDHMNMTKFDGGDDPGFVAVAGELRRWCRGLSLSSPGGARVAAMGEQGQPVHQRGPQFVVPYVSNADFVGRSSIPVDKIITATSDHVSAPFHHIPFPRNRRFVGRSAELEALTQKLLVNKDCRRLALVGLGGIGKTQVALEFAYAVKETQSEHSIFWVPALSIESFEQAYMDIARKLHVPQAAEEREDVKELVKHHLSTETAGRWLLILDNADDMGILFGSRPGQSKGVADYLPESENGLTVFTTRYQEAAVALAGSDVIEVEEMGQQEAVNFLEKSLTRKDLLCNDFITTELLDELTYLPLAITQAAAYINTNKISIPEYLRLLRNTEQDIISLMSREFRDNTRYKNSKNAVATTWLVSFDQILKHDVTAANLLSFMSCIEPKAIPLSILPGVEPEEEMVHAIGTLCAYAFVVRRGAEHTYDIHRLVHLATRVWVGEHGLAAEKTEKAIQHLARVFPSDDYANRLVWRAYLPHVLRLLGNKQYADIEERYQLCLRVGQCLRVDGRIREVVTWLEEAYRWRRNNFVEEHPDRLLAQHELAGAYQADGQVGKAVELLEHVVRIKEKVLVEEHPDRLASQHELAIAYQADGQVGKAVELLEHVATIQEKVLVEEHPDRLVSQHELAIVYQADGQVGKAVELLEHVVTIKEKVLVEEHPHRLASQHELAIVYEADGQVGKALELLEHVVRIKEKVLVEEHPDRLASQHTLAIAYQADGQVGKAVELLEHVVRIGEKVFVEEHPSRLASQHVLAIAYQADGQVGKALELLEHVVRIKEKVLVEEHPDRLVSQHVLAMAYQADGQVGKAVELLEHVVRIKEKVLRDDHPSRLVSQDALANLYAKLKASAESSK